MPPLYPSCRLLLFVAASASLLSFASAAPCPAGSILSGGNCVVCDPGTFTATIDGAACTICPKGTYAAIAGSIVCTVCPAGKYLEDDAGTDLEGSAAGLHNSLPLCLSCPAGTFLTDDATVNTLHASASQCLVCEAGTIAVQVASSTCTTCPSGRYLEAADPDPELASFHDELIDCEKCPVGTFLADAGTDPSEHVSASQCLLCPAGSYVSAIGMAACVICPAGRYNLSPPDNDVSLHDELSDCLVCPAGTYLSNAGGDTEHLSSSAAINLALHDEITDCTVCPAGRYNENDTSNFQNHDELTDCVKCPVGTYLSETVSGTHSERAAKHDSFDECLTCAAGRYTNLLMSAECIICPAGRYNTSPDVGDGPALHDYIDDCLVCPAGRYIDDPGADETKHNSLSKCIKCPGGTYLEDEGFEPTFHDSLVDCRVCAKGKYFEGLGAASCEACPLGKYIVDDGQLAAEHNELIDCIPVFSEMKLTVTPGGSSLCTPVEVKLEFVTTLPIATTDYLKLSMPGFTTGQCRNVRGPDVKDQTLAYRSPADFWNVEWYEGTPGNRYFDSYLYFYPVQGKGGISAGASVTIIVDKYFNIKKNCPSASDEEFAIINTVTNTRSVIDTAFVTKFLGSCYFTETFVRVYTPMPKSPVDLEFYFKPATRIDPGEIITFHLAGFSNSEWTGVPVYLASNHDSEADCLLCDWGKFSVAGSSSCGPEPCPGGQYISGSGCQPCPAGFYSQATSAVCLPCSTGKYSASGAAACTLCEAGTYAKKEESIRCSICDAGTYTPSSGKAECTECPAGRYLTNLATAASFHNGLNKCVLCAAGKFSTLAAAASANTCSDCQVGTYSAAGSATCTGCAVGKALNAQGGTACVICDAGFYAATIGQAVCTACPAGSYLVVAVGSSDANLHDSLDKCLVCTAGKYSVSIGATAIDTCTDCPAGTYNTDAGTSASFHDFLNDCKVCGTGKFSEALGATGESTCTNCADDTFISDASDASKHDEVADCLACAPATPSGTATIGDIGFDTIVVYTQLYNPSGSSWAFMANSGLVKSGNAAWGSVDTPDTSPNYAFLKQVATITQTISGLNVGYDYMITFKYSGRPAQSGLPAGGNNLIVTLGGEVIFTTTDIAAGTWLSGSSTYFEAAGTSALLVFSTTNPQDGDRTTFIDAVAVSRGPASTFSNPGASSCGFTKCASGTFVSGIGCASCVAGKFSISTAASCTSCAPGKWSTSGLASCTECALGKYFGSAGGTVSSCAVCNAGYYTPAAGAAACTACPAGRYSDESALAVSIDNCLKCQAGKSSIATAAILASTCVSCSKGKYSLEESSTCTSCLAGRFNGSTGGTSASVCDICSAGYYTAASGAAACTACPAGTYLVVAVPNAANLHDSLDKCSVCTAGKYSNLIGATLSSTCTVCPAGSYNTDAGTAASQHDSLKDCTICTAGTFSTTTGADSGTTCLSCVAGKYTAQELAPEPGKGGSDTDVKVFRRSGTDESSFKFKAKWTEGAYVQHMPGFDDSRLTLTVQDGYSLQPNVLQSLRLQSYDSFLGAQCSIKPNSNLIKVSSNAALGSVAPIAVDKFTGIGDGCSVLNFCSGHGTCDYCTETCTCYDEYGGLLAGQQSDISKSCNDRVCPVGYAWGSLPSSYNDGHAPTECSGAGYCDRSKGSCVCFPGFAGYKCDRRLCPVANSETCGGHGRCLSMRQLSSRPDALPLSDYVPGPQYGGNMGPPPTDERVTWDEKFGNACLCDSSWPVGLGAGETQVGEYFGPACQFRRCPSHYDPFTPLDMKPGKKLETDCEGVEASGGRGVGRAGNLCHVECSNRGTCKYATGECSCFEGWWGTACEKRMDYLTAE